jgi:hypothetical protein
VARAQPAVLTEAEPPVVPKVALAVAALQVGAVEVRAASLEGRCWAAAVGAPLRELALRPMWAVFDRSSRNPALSH